MENDQPVCSRIGQSLQSQRPGSAAVTTEPGSFANGDLLVLAAPELNQFITQMARQQEVWSDA